MSKNFSFKYEVSSQDSNFPARVILFDKPGKDCYIPIFDTWKRIKQSQPYYFQGLRLFFCS